ncbi:hypothetical protein D9M73_142850 [compost metagenome]
MERAENHAFIPDRRITGQHALRVGIFDVAGNVVIGFDGARHRARRALSDPQQGGSVGHERQDGDDPKSVPFHAPATPASSA